MTQTTTALPGTLPEEVLGEIRRESAAAREHLARVAALLAKELGAEPADFSVEATYEGRGRETADDDERGSVGVRMARRAEGEVIVIRDGGTTVGVYIDPPGVCVPAN